MNWNLAVEKNLEALKRILAMLVAMAGASTEGAGGTCASTLPRHLHRFVLSLLRPAEAATRRLIIVAARGLAVKLPKPRTTTGEQRAPRPDPRAMPEWARLRLQHGLPIEFPRGAPIPLWARETSRRETPAPASAPHVPFFPMFDPMKRFDRKPTRRRIPEDRIPRIALLNDDGWSAPLHLRQAPPPPTPDDPLDATRIHRRLEMIGWALDDLPRQAQRFARWQARRDARLAAERENAGKSVAETTPSPSRPSGSPRNGGEPEGRDGEGVDWEELGVTPEALALIRRSKLPNGQQAQPSITAQTAKPCRFHRIEFLRPGRPPGWRRKPTHEIHEILNDLHDLAVWVRDGPASP